MSEISTKDMVEALEVAFHRYPIYAAEYQTITAALLERDELQTEADRQRDIAIGFGERIKMLEKERDALKAKVEEQDKELELLGAGQRKFKARAEKAEAERDEWRDKAMFQQGRADEAIKIAAKPKVTREWVGTRLNYILDAGEVEDLDDPDGLIDALCWMLREAGVVVADEEGK